MSQIWINDTESVEGSFSFEITVDETSKPPIYSITGLFTTADKYVEELNTLQNANYRLENIHVYRESYGSEDDSVVYYFTAEAFGLIKGGD